MEWGGVGWMAVKASSHGTTEFINIAVGPLFNSLISPTAEAKLGWWEAFASQMSGFNSGVVVLPGWSLREGSLIAPSTPPMLANTCTCRRQHRPLLINNHSSTGRLANRTFPDDLAYTNV